jgi:hypothetical protein
MWTAAICEHCFDLVARLDSLDVLRWNLRSGVDELLFQPSTKSLSTWPRRADGTFYPSPRLFVACVFENPFAIERMRYKTQEVSLCESLHSL